MLQTEINGLLWWDWRNGTEAANNNSPTLYGWRGYGDYGMIRGAAEPYPTYYVSRLLTQFARGGEQVVTATSNYGLLAAYAVRNPATGTLNLLVINKNPTDTYTPAFTLSGFTPQGGGTAYSYGIPQDEAARTGSGSPDVAVQGLSGLTAGFSYSFAPYSATVLVLNEAPAAAGVQFSAAAYSAGEDTAAATFTVTRNGNTALPVSVDYRTNDNPAQVGCQVAGGQAHQRCDYLTATGTLNFAAGETTKTFSVILVDDLYVEGNETLTVSLTNPMGGAALGANTAATLTIQDNDTATPTANPLETAQFFVRQHYSDFLSRSPDAAGLDYWTGQLTNCGANAACLRERRVAVSNAFFFEQEFQKTGAYVYRLYRAAYGDTAANYRPGYAEFIADRARLNAALLAQNQLELAQVLTARAAFTAKYPATLTAAQFVDALLAAINAGSGVNLSSQRDTLIGEYNTGGRGAVLYRLTDDNAAGNPVNNRAFIDAEYNRAFVLTEYFGYLRRDPDAAGYDFWLGVVNQFPLRDANGQRGMVCAFITSQEYQERFSSVSPRQNSECP